VKPGSRISRRSFVLALTGGASCKLVIQASSQSPRSSNYYFDKLRPTIPGVASGDMTTIVLSSEPLRSSAAA